MIYVRLYEQSALITALFIYLDLFGNGYIGWLLFAILTNTLCHHKRVFFRSAHRYLFCSQGIYWSFYQCSTTVLRGSNLIIDLTSVA